MPDFRFSLPQITALTEDQQIAYHPRTSILVSGGPGSGKTVVTIYRFLRSVIEENTIMLFTYNKALIYVIKGTLRAQADELFGDLDDERITEIISEQLATFYRWHTDNIIRFNPYVAHDEMENNFLLWAANNTRYTEMFFDEGQDLPKTVYANSHILTETISIGADRAQNYKGHYDIDAAEDDIFDALKEHDRRAARQILQTNFRNTKEIFELAQKFVPNDLRVLNMNTEDLRRGNMPEIRVNLDMAEQRRIILRIIEQNQAANIGILFHFANEVMGFKDFMIASGYSCAMDAPANKSFSYYCNEILSQDEIVLETRVRSPFITTFDSCKGLEFDVVIMPYFESSTPATTKFNSEGRHWVTPNHYYVGVTRARNDIYILSSSTPAALSFLNAVK